MKSEKNVSDYLAAAGFPNTIKSVRDYDVDGEVAISETIHVQVGAGYFNVVRVTEDGSFVFYEDAPDLAGLLALVKQAILDELPEFATDLDQAYRYNGPVKSALIRFYPVTDYRPEAMRVTERMSDNAMWYEVETYNATQKRWIDQKTHPDKDLAMADAEGWYPKPAAE